MPLRFLSGTYVVTGAASSIGLETARALAEESLPVVMLDRDASAVGDAAAVLTGEGLDVEPFTADVADAANLDDLARRLAGRSVRGLAHVAGVWDRGTIDSVDPGSWRRMTSTNLDGSYLTCRAIVPLVRAAGGGAVVLTSSMTGRTTSQAVAPSYVASKAGVIGLTMSLGAQLASEGIRVNCVAPGKVLTPLFLSAHPDPATDHGEGVPLGRAASAREVADCIAFLLSQNASYVTGETVNVNGGMFMA